MPIIQNSAPYKYPMENYPIGKYMDLSKFLSLLYHKALFFCRLDKLEDKAEGKTPKFVTYEALKNTYSSFYINDKPPTEDQVKEHIDTYYNYEEAAKHVTCVNCWCKSLVESDALWKLYSDSSKGLMIKSHINSLYMSLNEAPFEIYPSEVIYKNYRTERFPIGNASYSAYHKNIVYEFENEVRLIFTVDEPQIGKAYDWSLEPIEQGKLVSVDLNTLIEEIVIAPFSPSWMRDAIEDLLGKFCLNKPVRESDFVI